MSYNLRMAIPIPVTKFYIPPLHPGFVNRSRLLLRLNEGLSLGKKLTLISAPAGFGKSSLVSDWIRHCRQPAAWVSLDEGDQDPLRFLTYCCASIKKTSTKIGNDAWSMLQSPQPPAIETIQATLINEISTAPEDFILVLDDYHLVASKAVDEVLAFLLEYLPSQMHIVITTREDPALPIAQLRARDQLTEIHTSDLRFSRSEVKEFLNQTMHLRLSAEEISILETRTEGWVSGLQLAALSMRGQEKVHEFIQTFAGDHRYILDYLGEEILQRQPVDVRNFLLQTSILERLHASLCDAVTCQSGSSARLENLLRDNLFIVPLDDNRHWYRYHHLFGDVLRAHLISEQPNQIPDLHNRASQWYEENNLTSDAVRHALAAQNLKRAADLIERAVPEMRRTRQEALLLGWLHALPGDLFQNRPVLNIHRVWTLLATGKLEGIEKQLKDIEHWLEKPLSRQKEMIIVDQAEFHRLPELIAMYRAAYSMGLGKINDTLKYAQQALDLIDPDDPLGQGAALSLLGLASWTGGDLTGAELSYNQGIVELQQADHLSDAIGCALALADIQMMQGRLHKAMNTYKYGLQLAGEQKAFFLRGAADMYVGMSELYYERNDLVAAKQYLMKGEELGEFAGLPQNRYRWRVAMANIHQAQGNFDDALKLLDAAEQLYIGDFSPNVFPIPARRARVWIKLGKLDEAMSWARESGLSVEDEPKYLQEFSQITLARIVIAQSGKHHAETSLPKVILLLERLLQAAERGGRNRSVLEVLILLSIAHQMTGDPTAAIVSLEHALTLAESEGFVRIFLDEGLRMKMLLREFIKYGNGTDYADKLLLAFEVEKYLDEETPADTSTTLSPLIEPLSQRELDILRLFKTDLSGPEIAEELVIALSTVRTHTKNIYNKLNVKNRRAAVRQAIALGLI